MEISYDPRKNQRNIDMRQLSFEAVADFDFAAALIAADTRRAYPETRYVAIGPIGARCMCCVLPPPPRASV